MRSHLWQLVIVVLIISLSVALFLKDLKLVSATYDENFSYVRNSIYLVNNLKWDQEYINLHPPLLYYAHGWPFILSEKTPEFMPEMKRILSEDQRTTAFRPWESILLPALQGRKS